MTTPINYSAYSAEVQSSRKSFWGLILFVLGSLLGFAAGGYWVLQTKPEFLLDYHGYTRLEEAKKQLTLVTIENFDLEKKLAAAETLLKQYNPSYGSEHVTQNPPIPAGQWHEIKRFSGSSNKVQTETFVLDGEETRFKITPTRTAEMGNYLGIILKKPPNQHVKLLYNEPNEEIVGAVEVSFGQKGEYFLDVSSMRTNWEIVVEVKK